jgi:extradiol dioxygenase family protein
MVERVTDFYGKCLGTITDEGNRRVARDFYGKQLGYYDKASDTTHDFYGRIIAHGDATSGLIMSNAGQN